MKKPVFKRIPASEISTDYSYQREPSKKKIAAIVKEFDWRRFDAVKVSSRNGAGYFVVDGNHRVCALMQIDPSSLVPCMVVDCEDAKQEALVFGEQDKNKSRVSPYHKIRAKVLAGDKKAIAVVDTIKKHKYRLAGNSGEGKNTVCAVAAVLKIADSIDMLDRVFGLCAEVAAGEQIDARLLKGVRCLVADMDSQKVDILHNRYRQKLRLSGYWSIITSINNRVAKEGRGAQEVWARGILDIINSGRRSGRLTFGGSK